MNKALIGLLFFFSVTTIAKEAIQCARACDRPDNCRRTFALENKKIDFYSNFSLDQINQCIQQVVVVVHGAERNAEARYDAALDAAKSLGKEQQVLIISPFFKTSEDDPSSNDIYWTSSGWRQGNTSVNSGRQVSSFAVADAIFDSVFMSESFPNITRASVTGHSAGGQYAQMYALTTRAPIVHNAIAFQFLVLNPSNYTYFNSMRPHPTIANRFELPVYWTGSSWRMVPVYRNAAGNCPNDYNDYKYGLEERNLYASQWSSATLVSQYIDRDVFYFLGELDRDENDDSLDTSCEAKLQGRHRLERGQNYFDFLNLFYPENQHNLGIIAGVGHDARAMYASSPVKTALFGQ